MADQSDVETALATLAATTLYPLGTGNASVIGAVLRVYRGWPGNAALEADISAGICHVSVCAVDGAQVLTSRFPQVWEIPLPATTKLTVSSTSSSVTFGDDAEAGQLAGILVDDDAFAYRTQTGDTPQRVAASLGALIASVRSATVAGAAVNVLDATRLVGRVVVDQAALMQLRRQRGEFKLTVWTPDPATRDAAATAIDTGFALAPFIGLQDGSVGRLEFVRSDTADSLSTLPLYRRDLTYSVEYATTLSQTQPSMLFGLFGIAGAAGLSHLTIS